MLASVFLPLAIKKAARAASVGGLTEIDSALLELAQTAAASRRAVSLPDAWTGQEPGTALGLVCAVWRHV